MEKISAIVLTFNERKNLELCLKSIKPFVEEIFIVDSFSTDNTIKIAQKFTSKIYKHKFINQAKQFNWAQHNLPIKTEWIMRVDADERWSKKGFKELFKIIKIQNPDGIYVKMKIYFMGRWIKHGAFYPNYFLRVFKKSKGQIEDRWMDEHIKVKGKTIKSNIDVIESNYDRQQNISLWTDKHNKYSTREAIEYFITKYKLSNVGSIAKLSYIKTERKRWIKENIYSKMPLFIRPFFYFMYRYFFRLGFLDGKEGFIFHFLQGFWYRFLVDTKIYQIYKKTDKNKNKILELLNKEYGIKLK